MSRFIIVNLPWLIVGAVGLVLLAAFAKTIMELATPPGDEKPDAGAGEDVER